MALIFHRSGTYASEIRAVSARKSEQGFCVISETTRWHRARHGRDRRTSIDTPREISWPDDDLRNDTMIF